MHDPGGKARFTLPNGLKGDAKFSNCGRYRYWLSRSWQDSDGQTALWIGLNPSTASAETDDPTVRREVNFTRTWNLAHYVKMNVFDYRATNPKQLLQLDCPACSPSNFPQILSRARSAYRIILAYGAMHQSLRGTADQLVEELIKAGHSLWCVGTTKDGSPRHPLYTLKSSSLVKWPAETPVTKRRTNSRTR